LVPMLGMARRAQQTKLNPSSLYIEPIMPAAPDLKSHHKAIGGIVLTVAAIAVGGAVAVRVSASGKSPGATQIALSLAGPAGAALAPVQTFERDPSVPAAATIFSHSAFAVDSYSPSF